MSSPSAVKPSESPEKKSPEELKKNSKMEEPVQHPTINGNGVATSESNGQEEKPGNREIPGLLPLVKQPPPPLLPMVVATKSAPPPIPPTKSKTHSPSKEQPTTAKGKQNLEKLESVEEASSTPKNKKVGRKKRHSVASSDSTEKADGDSGGDTSGRKSKRARTKTQPFQSSDMDLNFLRAIKATAVAAQKVKIDEDKLVVFFKGEHLAVRNAEGGFYICQAMQNISRGSHKIRIRWLSQAEPAAPSKSKKKASLDQNNAEAKDESGLDVYTADFYDNTDFECILTNLELEKLGTNRYVLPVLERQRTENILRRAIQVEQQGVGVDELQVTEEHPDGLDVSLLRDESQLVQQQQRKQRRGRKKSGGADSAGSDSEQSADDGEVASSSCEPSTSVVASTSTGRGTKRTRAAAMAAATKKIQSKIAFEESSDDDDHGDIVESSSSDSDTGKRRRGRPSPRARPSPPAGNRRSGRQRKPSPPPKRTKAAMKETVEVHVEKVGNDVVKIVTVDVEMTSPEESEPDVKESIPQVKVTEAEDPVEEPQVEKTPQVEESKTEQPEEKKEVEDKKETVETVKAVEENAPEAPKAPTEDKTDSSTKTDVKDEKDVKDVRPETKPEIQPDATPETKPEAKSDVKPEVKSDVKPEAKSDVKPEVKTDVKPEADQPKTDAIETPVGAKET